MIKEWIGYKIMFHDNLLHDKLFDVVISFDIGTPEEGEAKNRMFYGLPEEVHSRIYQEAKQYGINRSHFSKNPKILWYCNQVKFWFHVFHEYKTNKKAYAVYKSVCPWWHEPLLKALIWYDLAFLGNDAYGF